MKHLKIFNKKEDYNLEIGDNLNPLFPNISLVEENGRKVMNFNPKPRRKATFNVKNVGDELFPNAENLKRVGIGNEVIYEVKNDSSKTTIITTKNDIYEFDEQYNFMPNKRYCGQNITSFTVEVDGGIIETDTVLLGSGGEWDGTLSYGFFFSSVSDLCANGGYLSDGVLYFPNEDINYLAKYGVGIIIQRDNVFLDTIINVVGVEEIPTTHFITNETLENEVIPTERCVQIMMETTSVIDENTKIMLKIGDVEQIEDITPFYHTSNFLLSPLTFVNLDNGIITFCRYDENNNVQIIDTKVTVFNFPINPTDVVIKSPLNGCVEVWFETINRFVSPRFGTSLTNNHSHLLKYNKIISDETFYNCNEITKITIPDSVTSIGSSAFRYCSSLTSVTIPSSVTTIGSNAFDGCTSLTSVTIPSSVTSIGSNAFYNCEFKHDKFTNNSSLTNDGNWGANLYDVIQNDGLYISGTTAVKCRPNATNITIPNGITSIAENAFYDCSSLKSVTIPSSVTTIGQYAFCYCVSLTSVTIPNSVTSIGGYAFSGCYFQFDKFINNSSLTHSNNWSANLCDVVQDDGLCINVTTAVKCRPNATNVIIPSSVTKIDYYAFSSCSSLTSITIPDSVTNIGDYAFSNCTSLTTIEIPSSVTSIGSNAFYNTPFYNNLPNGEIYLGSCYYKYNGAMPSNTSITIKDGTKSISNSAFSGCTSLTSVIIPDSVTKIGYYAFSGCTSLTSVTIGSGVTSIGDNAFYNCRCLTSVTISDSVTFIGGDAFSRCSSLTSVTIGSDVTRIGYNAFGGCISLSSITCLATTAPSVGVAFSNLPSNGTLYVPSGSDYSSWLSNLPSGWTIEYI